MLMSPYSAQILILSLLGSIAYSNNHFGGMTLTPGVASLVTQGS